ncbi:CBS domain-containing protein (plasmid) [Agrobacterium radiobacter]|uniref:Putative Cystathionine beta-synthase n=1 Tax=Agrobacterium tumefaciens str. B6 TaxID=1183423 RepID=A0A822VBU3_AGRTU|nr:CBS domain-containing protein [Agrobacterium tumefaciens]KWT87363.1 hypothetical protein ASB65_21480 [Agrobacterium tumefaciens str. B6]MQB27692.1 CBS domain-containing protein [Agrobacterium tumefaciens]NTA08521.1 CBS domain-containing protein [Agrobacterium tumefaciens]NTA94701.1 CBS domain-containing protein [Agrobacterium tumefaciens]NTB16008.1 CBS domain-containing protein [Agrobacterium tumefaciens]
MRIEKLYPMISARLMIIDVAATVQTAAATLSNPGIGLAIICSPDGRAKGVLSKSDLIRHIADHGRSNSVEELMSPKIIACQPADDLQSAWQIMISNRLQNMPVLGAEGRPLGVLDMRDALKVLYEQEQLQEQMMENYIAGIGY